MSHNNRYYTINATDPNINDIYDIIVGTPESQRYNLNGDKIVIKLHHDDLKNYDFLSDYTEYNHPQIIEIMQSPEWTDNLENDE